MKHAMLFFDIDGTILSDKTGLIADSTKKAIKQAQENGNYVFVNTGRTICGIDEEIKKMGFHGYVCGCGTYIEYEGKVLLSKTIEGKLAKKIIADLRKYKLEGFLEGKDKIYYETNPSHKEVLRIRDKNIGQGFSVGTWEEEDTSFDKFVFWEQDSSDYETFYEKYCNDFTFIDRGDTFFEVIPKGYSKASGIQYLMEYLKVPHEDTFAIGDSTNDLPMLEFAANSIAMGNSSKGLADIVSYVTADTEHDGIQKALSHYKLI